MCFAGGVSSSTHLIKPQLPQPQLPKPVESAMTPRIHPCRSAKGYRGALKCVQQQAWHSSLHTPAQGPAETSQLPVPASTRVCTAALRRVWKSLSKLIQHKLTQHPFPVFSLLSSLGGSEAELRTGGDTQDEGRAEGGEQGWSHTAQQAPLCNVCGAWGSPGVSDKGNMRLLCATKCLGLQSVWLLWVSRHSLLSQNLAERIWLLTVVSLQPCGTARAGCVLTAGREQGAKCPPPSTGNGQHQPQGRTWRVCVCNITLSNLVLFCTAAGLSALFPGLHAAPWDRNLRLAQNTTPVPLAYRASALSSVELHEGKAGHLNLWLGCHTCIFTCYKATQLRQVPGCARHLGWRDPPQESP